MPTPIIATFYSFRGGVGRTMAMLNAGWVLARTGSRVLLIDFDLEAPGLTRLIARQDLFAGAAESVPGMADIIVQLLDRPDEWAFHADKPLPIDLSPYLRELKLPDPKFDWLPRGRLALISAGAEAGYEGRLARIHTEQFTQLHAGFAARFREALLKSGQFDYILIDARTGFSDEAYIACRYLCDRLVVLTGLNDQNIEGTGRFLSKVAAWSEKEPRPRNIILIASPVPEHEEELKAQRFAQAKARLAELSGAKPEFALQLPYHPRLSLYEELIVERFPQSGLAREYQQLAGMLRGAAQDSLRDWSHRGTEAITHGDMEAALAAARRAAAIDATQGNVQFLQVGLTATRLGRHQDARAAFEQALASSRELADSQGISASLYGIAGLDYLQGRYSEARCGYEQSLAIDRQLGDRAGTGRILHQLAELDRIEGRYAEAWRHYQEALAFFRELGDRREISVTLQRLAEIDRLDGRYAEAQRGFDEALAILRELGDPREIAMTRLDLETARAQEDAGPGLAALMAVVEEARQCPDPIVAARSYLRLGEVLRQRGELSEAHRELSAGIEFAERCGFLALAADMSAERALAAVDAGDPAQAAADARAAIAFFDAESVAHPQLARLRKLAAAADAPKT